MDEREINRNLANATFERIAGYTVGIAVENNTAVGTGTLITDGTNRYILTAAHVIEGTDLSNARFWLRPNSALIERAAANTTDREVGRLTFGVDLPIVKSNVDPPTDIAILTIDEKFVAPESVEFYNLGKSQQVTNWPADSFDGTSIAMFGFPSANSRPVKTVGNNTFCFIGVAMTLSRYSKELNDEGFKKLSSDVSPEKDFLFTYNGMGEGIHPRGFSGCGVWIPTETQGHLVWNSDPMLIGVVNRYFPTSNVISATKLPSIVEINPSST